MSEPASPSDMTATMAQLRMPEGCNIRRKETFEYVTPHYTYNVELFQNADNTWYAIAVPRDSDRLVVYGSSVLSSAQLALQSLIDKIKREGMQQLFGTPDGMSDGDADDTDAESDESESAAEVLKVDSADEPDHPVDEY
jgi:hypothetical protein